MKFDVFGRITNYQIKKKKITDSCFGGFICSDCHRIIELLSFNLAYSYSPDPDIGPDLCQIQSVTIHGNTDSHFAIVRNLKLRLEIPLSKGLLSFNLI